MFHSQLVYRNVKLSPTRKSVTLLKVYNFKFSGTKKGRERERSSDALNPCVYACVCVHGVTHRNVEKRGGGHIPLRPVTL